MTDFLLGVAAGAAAVGIAGYGVAYWLSCRRDKRREATLAARYMAGMCRE